MTPRERTLKKLRRERLERILDDTRIGVSERMNALAELNRLDRELARAIATREHEDG